MMFQETFDALPKQRTHGAKSSFDFNRWLQSKLRAAKNGPYAEAVLLTPEIAAGLLAQNPENRNVNLSYVADLVSDITAGRWAMNGETIIVSEEGYLNDGQHRCHAIVIADTAVDTMIVFGVERDSRTTVDEGRARTVANYLTMEGDVKNAPLLASVANKLIEIRREGRLNKGRNSPTKQEVLEECRTDKKLADSVAFITGKSKRARKVCSESIIAVAHYLIAEKNKAKADEFISTMLSGEHLGATDPRFVCREKLQSRALRLNGNEQLKTIIHAYNNWRKGITVKTVQHQMRKGDKLPEVTR